VTRHISVGATVRDAYAFVGAHLGGIIAVIWLPTVLMTVAQFFTFNRSYNDFIDTLASGNAAHMGPALLMLLGYLVAKLLLTALMCVGVVQLALGGRPTPALIYIAFGPVEGRLFRAFCGFAGMLLMVGITVLTLANMAMAAQGGPSRQFQEAIGALLMLALLGTGLILSARFVILAPAIAAGETAPVLRRAWALSTGNFWPLLGALVTLFLPLLVFFIALEAGLGQRGAAPPTGSTPELQMVAALMHARQMLPLTCGLSFFFSPLVIGLFAGASVSAWRALKDEPSVDISV
jgi:hypothetical protein